MRQALLSLCIASLFAGCPSERASGSADAGNGLQAEALEATPQEGDADGGYRVHAEKLERFIKYQERTLALYAVMLDELAKAEASKDAGAGAGSVARVKKHAEAQEKVRTELGLSERDIRELEQIVGDVISRRSVSNAAEEDESIRQMEALAAKLPEEQRAQFEATISSLRMHAEQTRSLAEERAKYGDGNVEAVLTREAELTRHWNQAISTFSGSKTKRPTSMAPVPNTNTNADAGWARDAGAAVADAGR